VMTPAGLGLFAAWNLLMIVMLALTIAAMRVRTGKLVTSGI